MLDRTMDLTRSVLRGEVRFARFLAVGVLNTAFGYGVFALGIWLGLHYSAAIACATVLGTLFNFKSTGNLVFGSSDNGRLFRFVSVYAIVYLLNVASVGALVRLGFSEYISGLFVLLPLAVVSYWLNSRFVFHNAKEN